MGANLNSIGRMLGIGGQQQPQQPQLDPNPLATIHGQVAGPGGYTGPQSGGLSAQALLGTQPSQSQLPPIASNPQGGHPSDPNANDDAPLPSGNSGDIVVNGSHTNAPAVAAPMSPSTFGMPGMAPSAPADPDAISALHQQLADKANMARQIYNPGSEFGTHGILRDVVGNVEDLGRRLLGFAPRYNDEKFAERAYGMSSSDPNVAAAATEQAMQYNPAKTEAYQRELETTKAQQVNSQATSAYKNSLVQTRIAQQLSGAGAALGPVMAQYNPNDPASVNIAEAQYQRMLPLIKAAQAQLPGGGANVPDHFDPAFVQGLMQQGYNGSNVERAMQAAGHETAATDRNNATIQGRHEDTTTRGQYYVEGQNAGNSSRERIAQMPQRPPAPQTKTITRTPNGSIISPGYTQEEQTGPSAAPAPSGPPVGYRSKSGFIFHGGDYNNRANWSK